MGCSKLYRDKTSSFASDIAQPGPLFSLLFQSRDTMSFDLVTLLALDSPMIRRRRAKKRRKEWVNSILAKRRKYGEFFLYSDLQNSEEHHFSYFRMQKDTFGYILEKIQDHVVKYSNFRETVPPEERLTITLRYVKKNIYN